MRKQWTSYSGGNFCNCGYFSCCGGPEPIRGHWSPWLESHFEGVWAFHTGCEARRRWTDLWHTVSFVRLSGEVDFFFNLWTLWAVLARVLEKSVPTATLNQAQLHENITWNCKQLILLRACRFRCLEIALARQKTRLARFNSLVACR